MLPVPPLDGSKLLLAARIPMVVYVELSRVGFMLLVSFGDVDDQCRRLDERLELRGDAGDIRSVPWSERRPGVAAINFSKISALPSS